MPVLLFPAAVFALSIYMVWGQSPVRQKKAPNIIILLADDLGWGDVGYHGSTIRTPNIDRLAGEGVILNRFYTAAVCSPTRAGLMTGRYPDRFGLRTTVIPPWSTFGVDTSEVFLPELLGRGTYANRAILNKWHLGHASRAYHPLRRGFTHFYGHLNGAIDYFTHKREGELDWHNDFESSFDEGYSTDLIADEAIRNIRDYNGDDPFFIYVAFNAPHAPLQAKEEDLSAYGYSENKTYSTMVSNLDNNIGRILQVLDELQIGSNTLVLFASDNGAAPGEGGSSGILRGTKFTEWEGGIRAPAIVRWPDGFKGGYVSNQVMGYVDVLPTLLEAAGVTVDHKKPLDGISMLPVLIDSTKRIERDFFLGSGALVNSSWKLIEASDKNPRMKLKEDQLFHISRDSSESQNIRHSPKADQPYRLLKSATASFNAIVADQSVPDYGEGRKNFVAPKNWQIPH